MLIFYCIVLVSCLMYCNFVKFYILVFLKCVIMFDVEKYTNLKLKKSAYNF